MFFFSLAFFIFKVIGCRCALLLLSSKTGNADQVRTRRGSGLSTARQEGLRFGESRVSLCRLKLAGIQQVGRKSPCLHRAKRSFEASTNWGSGCPHCCIDWRAGSANGGP
ncbi:uncharacterized protein P884DRAFT_257092 [Thermothelomyces heterothallicus CBS 202.75]|uniref:uncharacterized protein n=1 Tax=Thermothelomyces heterothallicus CBS 202.75 TaxID=1149848 RepID=UPI00374308FE